MHSTELIVQQESDPLIKQVSPLMPDTVMVFFFPILLLHFGTSAQTVTDGVLEKKVAEGTLRGARTMVGSKQIETYFGVPFGKPPIGHLRFQPPHKVEGWSGMREAVKLSPACYQEKDETFQDFWGSQMWNAQGEMSEDCLYLNIWTPSSARDLPVMVWLFGGGFWYGSPSLGLYDGRGMAAEGKAVVVNINYRVGPLGFLFLNHSDAPGNMGMLDQQLAMQWIQDNIHVFGGDPNKVTLFGESAGAASVVAHMVAPGSRKLFNRGILQSGTLDNRWAMDGVEKAYKKGVNYLEKVGCADGINIKKNIACLRDKDAKTLGQALWPDVIPFLEFPFVIVSSDQFFFQGKDAFRALREADYETKDLIIGLNQDEGMFWNIYNFGEYMKRTMKQAPILSRADYLKAVEKAFAALPDVVHRGAAFQYSQHCHTLPTYTEGLNQMVGDYFFTCDSLWLADALVKAAKSNVFVYYFTQRSSTNPWPRWMGVMHGYEIEYVFGIPIVNTTAVQNKEGENMRYSNREIKLSREIIQYWVSFGEIGRPELREGKGAKWKAYTGYNRNWFELGTKPGSHLVNKSENCKMWRSVKDIEYWHHLIINSGSSLPPFSAMLLLTPIITLLF